MARPGRRVARRPHVRVLVACLPVAIAVTVAACGGPPRTSDPSADAMTSAEGGPTPSSAAPSSTLGTDGDRIYAVKCAGCHGTAGEGNLGPALVGIADRMTAADQIAVVSDGRGTMLAFSPALTDEQIAAVVDYTRPQLP